MAAIPMTRRTLLRHVAAAGAGVAMAPLLTHAGRLPVLAQQPGGFLYAAQEVDPVSLDPHNRSNFSSFQAFEHIYESLVAYDKSMNIVPSLAQSWSTPDPTTFVFALRRNVRFHDGSELVADDVKYSLDRALDPKTASPWGGIIKPFVDRVEVVDRSTVRLRLTKPYPPLLGWFAYRRGSGIAKAGSAEKMNLNVQAIGTGPFALKEYLPESHIIFTKHKGYWDSSLPHLDGFMMKVLVQEDTRVAGLVTRSLDYAFLSPEGAERLKGAAHVNVMRSLRAFVTMLRTNPTRRPWSDVRVRQALALGIDRKAIIEKAAGGAGVLSGFIPTGYGDWYTPADKLPWRHDPDRARRLLTEAGFPQGFRTTIKASPQYPEFISSAVVIADNLKQIGVDAQIQQMEWGQFVRDTGAAGGNNYDLAITAFVFRHDPDGYFRFYYHSKDPNNPGYLNPKVDDLMDKAVTTADRRERKRLYTEMERILADEVPYLPLYTSHKVEAIQRRVKGYVPMFSDSREFFKETWIERG